MLTTIMYKLNYDYIFKNFLKPELWEKEWCLFNHDDLKIMAKLYKINMENKEVEMKIYKSDDRWNISYAYFYYDKAHYNPENFQNSVNSAVLNVIEQYERKKIFDTTEFLSAVNTENTYIETLTDRANDFLDKNNVKNEEIRDAYIDSFVFNNMIRFTDSVIEKYKYRLTTNMYVLYASYVVNNKLFERFRPYLEESPDLESIMEEIEEVKDNIEQGYYQDMEMPEL